MDIAQTFMSMNFTAYVALAVVLYAIRQATGISNKYIPLTAVVLGVAFSMLQFKAFDFQVMMTGIQYGLYGIGTVASIKYTLTKSGTTTPKSK
ncbi:hypothetical protein LCL95_11515 [Bacillus timonensis]|nr:hypothetical protein [Bacillus timonensis]